LYNLAHLAIAELLSVCAICAVTRMSVYHTVANRYFSLGSQNSWTHRCNANVCNI